MAAPQFVPRPADTDTSTRSYVSPPRRPEPWASDRPGDLGGDGQPHGARLGSQGPDLGFALLLARRFTDRLVLAEGEHADDVVAGCVALAMKRASLYGRAPVVHDLTVAFTLWGYLDDAPDELVAFRRPRFEGVAGAHHYGERRDLVDLVPDDALRRTPDQVRAAAATDWRALLGAA